MLRKWHTVSPKHQRVVKDITKGAYGILLGGMAMDAVALQMTSLHPEMSHRLYRFGKPNWICNVKSQFLQNKWGQPIDYAPFPTFQIAKELYPNHPIDSQQMTFEMMSETIKKQREVIRERGIDLFDNDVAEITEDPNNGDMLVELDNGHVERIPSGGNHYVINATRHVNLPNGIPDDVSHCIQSSDNLYTKDAVSTNPEKIVEREQIIMFGGGRNLDWALMHFPDKDIIHVIPKDDRMREDLDNPDYVGRLRHVMLDEVKLRMGERGNNIFISGQDIKGGKLGIFVPKTNCYSAMGTTFNANVLRQFPHDKVVEIDTVKSPEMHIEGGLAGIPAKTF